MDLLIGTLNQFNPGKCNTIKFLIATVIYLYILIMSSKGIKRKKFLILFELKNFQQIFASRKSPVVNFYFYYLHGEVFGSYLITYIFL